MLKKVAVTGSCPVNADLYIQQENQTIMLQERELATIRAALQFWREEIVPHGEELARPYFDVDQVVPLSDPEIQDLQDQFQPARVRYARLVVGGSTLATVDLFENPEPSQQSTSPVATILLPASA